MAGRIIRITFMDISKMASKSKAPVVLSHVKAMAAHHKAMSAHHKKMAADHAKHAISMAKMANKK